MLTGIYNTDDKKYYFAFDTFNGDENQFKEYILKSQYRDSVRFIKQDVRKRMPGGPFHLILCQ